MGLSHLTSSIYGVSGNETITNIHRFQGNNLKVNNATIDNIRSTNASIANASFNKLRAVNASITVASADILKVRTNITSNTASVTTRIVTGSLQVGFGADRVSIDVGNGIELQGNTTVWQDENIGGAVLLAVPGLAPGVVSLVSTGGANTGISTYGVAVGEAVSGVIEIPHKYYKGTDIQCHVHWQGLTAPSGVDYVKWKLKYIVNENGLVVPATTAIYVEDSIATQALQQRSDFPFISGSGIDIGNQFAFTLRRVTSSGDAYAGEAALMTIGIHYQVNTMGSRTINEK